MRKVADVEELEREMRAVLVTPTPTERSWDSSRQTLVADYRKALAARAGGAGRRHAAARARLRRDGRQALIKIERRFTGRKAGRS